MNDRAIPSPVYRELLTEPEDDYLVTEQVGHLIRKAHQRHTAIFQQLSCDSQLTPIQFATLCTLFSQGPRSLTDIVRATAIDQATIRGVVSRLKKRQFIELTSDESDQRKVIVRLTPEGCEVVKKMIPCANDITEQTLKNLNPTERVALLFLLRKLNE